ncbi:MarR family winged helix-turn-helix transcriptional regulator [Pusillimonas caeni]|uniref:MarR family winged helix-turn-helix transcriptional regulator n=1 Tax=Pusillimonas caeni TaxID=1348472 RepID=UPI001FD7B251|nr:MarR family transcriptional regulator [Pusillimonas caeni]
MASSSAASPARTGARAGRSQEPEETLKPSLMHQLIGYHCRRAFVQVEPFSDARMSAFALRPADFAVLSLLSANPGISQKQVAHGIGVAPPNLAPVLERLEARRLLARQRSRRDGRIQTFSLTADGQVLCTLAEEAALRIESEAAGALTDGERKTLLRLLRKLYASDVAA